MISFFICRLQTHFAWLKGGSPEFLQLSAFPACISPADTHTGALGSLLAPCALRSPDTAWGRVGPGHPTSHPGTHSRLLLPPLFFFFLSYIYFPSLLLGEKPSLANFLPVLC